MISKLLDVMILNKSSLLFINHFDSINKKISNKECFHLNRETKLQHITKTKQNKTMELLTPAMICWLTLFQGFKQTTLCYCYNRRRGKKAQPRKQSLFQHEPLSLPLPKKKTNMNRCRLHLQTFGYY